MTLAIAGQTAAAEIGIEWRDVPLDGRWHEVPVTGKGQRNGAGRIRLFPDGDGGHAWNHTTGEDRLFWKQGEADLDPAAREARRKRAEEARTLAEADRRRVAEEAARKAGGLWKAGREAAGNPYLDRKGVPSVPTLRQIDAALAAQTLGYFPRNRGEDLTGALLVVPLKVGDRLTSVQLIDGAGHKHFLAGGPIGGGYWSTGPFPDGDGDGCTMLISEGVATALSCWEATGNTALAAMSCGNLPAVSVALRQRFPAARLIVCSDRGNGEKDARRAAIQGQALLAVPQIEGDGTDFNDLQETTGLEEVRRQIEAAVIPEPFATGDQPEESTPEAPETETQAPSQRLRVIDVIELLSIRFPPRENLLAPWLPQQGLCMVYAPRGIGKTHFSLGVSYAVASGGSFLKWPAPMPRGVLFLDGEMPGVVLQERLARIAASNEKEPSAPLRIITPDLQPRGMINLSDPVDQATIAPHLEGIGLIVVDNLSTLCRSGKEAEGESWLPVQQWALEQRAAGRSVLFIHHSGKNGEQRGTSRREDVLDTVIALKRPGDYTPDKGASFELHFEKARGIYGDDTKPFEATLLTDREGRQTWALKELEASTAEKVAKLLTEGVPQGEIGEMLGLTKGAVSKAKKRAQEMGLLR